jgi:hypothetical protein
MSVLKRRPGVGAQEPDVVDAPISHEDEYRQGPTALRRRVRVVAVPITGSVM